MLGRRCFLGSVTASAIFSARSSLATCFALGHFEGKLVAELLQDGRSIKLQQPYAYVDRCGRYWIAPSGSISDGASIPAFLWRLVGTPLVGKYRDAAVIHDWYCSVRTENYLSVHRMFYEAMIASGVESGVAWRFYLGVRIGGPSWDELTVANSRLAEIKKDQRYPNHEYMTHPRDERPGEKYMEIVAKDNSSFENFRAAEDLITRASSDGSAEGVDAALEVLNKAEKKVQE